MGSGAWLRRSAARWACVGRRNAALLGRAQREGADGAGRHAGDRQRAGGAAGGGAVGEARQVGAGGRPRPAARRRVGAYRHDPVEDAARDRPEPLGLARAGVLRPRVQGQAGHLGQRPRAAADQDPRPRGRGAAAPVHAQHGAERLRRGAVRRAERGRADDRRRRGQPCRLRARADRGRDGAVPAGQRAVRPAAGVRQRRDPRARAPAPDADGGGRRGDRGRVCDDLLRARRAGDAGRAARHDPRLRRPRDRRRLHPPDARPRDDRAARLRDRRRSRAASAGSR